MFIRCMRRSLCFVTVVIWFLALPCVLARPAYAYVDPGSGLLMLQSVGSAFFGITFLLRKHLGQIFERLGGRPKRVDKSVE